MRPVGVIRWSMVNTDHTTRVERQTWPCRADQLVQQHTLAVLRKIAQPVPSW